jgi:hypothetical protein
MNMERMTFINFILIKIKTIIYAIIAILIGTLLADNLMWYSIKLSSKKKFTNNYYIDTFCSHIIINNCLFILSSSYRYNYFCN